MSLCWLLSPVERVIRVRVLFFFFKQKTAYEMRISDWSSDVCSSDLDQIFPDTLIFLVGKDHAFGGAALDGSLDLPLKAAARLHAATIVEGQDILVAEKAVAGLVGPADRQSTRLNSSH